MLLYNMKGAYIMKNTITNFTDKITDRITYKDINGSELHSGSLVLFIQMDSNFKSGYKYFYNSKKINPIKRFKDYKNSSIAVFYRDSINKCIKLFFGMGKNKPFVKTIYDENVIKFTRTKKLTEFNLPCLTGDFWKNNEEFKKINNYYNAIDAYNKYFPINNK